MNDVEQVPGHEMPEGELVTVPLPPTLTVSVCAGSEVNVALTLSALFIVTPQDPVPEQAPDQPVNLYPRAAEAESVTEVPWRNDAEQVPGHEMPEGELVTVPLPLTLTVSVSSGLNVAVTLLALVIVTEQTLVVPEQAPDQPAKPYPLEGVAVSKTVVPYENCVAQIPGQEMPEGELITVPLPLTLTVSVSGTGLNVAPTLWAPFIASVQVPVPEQGPDQPAKLYPEEGEAVSVTVVPKVNAAEQALGQEMPVGELVTLPLPLTLTVSVSGGPYCVIVAGPSSPADPKLTNRLPDRVAPVFAATVYGVVQVMS